MYYCDSYIHATRSVLPDHSFDRDKRQVNEPMNYTNFFDFNDKVVLVSGASRGIGAAIAHGFAANGAEVLVSSRRREACQAVVDKIAATGGRATAYACHQGNMEDIEQLFDAIRTRYDRLDVLINCGATSPWFGPAAETPESAYDKTFEVNLKGPFYMSAKAIALMQRRKSGAIVNIASINGISAGRHRCAYSMTKAAMISMTGCYAAEYGAEGIRVNAIAPGLIDTKLSSALTRDPQKLSNYLSEFAIPRIGQPDDIVAGALYLASDAAAFTTGITLTIDGGVTI